MYIMSAEMFSLLLRTCILSGKETDCLCTRVTKCRRCMSLYILMSEKVAHWRESTKKRSSYCSLLYLMLGHRAMCHTWFPYTFSGPQSKINPLCNFLKRLIFSLDFQISASVIYTLNELMWLKRQQLSIPCLV